MHTRSRRLREMRAALVEAERDARGDFPPALTMEQAQEYALRYDTALERHRVLLDRWLNVVAEGTARSAGKRTSMLDVSARESRATWPVANWLFTVIPRLRIGSTKADVFAAVDLLQSLPRTAPPEVQAWVARQRNGVTYANVKKIIQRWRGHRPKRSTLMLREPKLTQAELRAMLGLNHIKARK